MYENKTFQELISIIEMNDYDSLLLSGFTGTTKEDAIKYIEESKQDAMQSIWGIVEGC